MASSVIFHQNLHGKVDIHLLLISHRFSQNYWNITKQLHTHTTFTYIAGILMVLNSIQISCSQPSELLPSCSTSGGSLQDLLELTVFQSCPNWSFWCKLLMLHLVVSCSIWNIQTNKFLPVEGWNAYNKHHETTTMGFSNKLTGSRHRRLGIHCTVPGGPWISFSKRMFWGQKNLGFLLKNRTTSGWIHESVVELLRSCFSTSCPMWHSVWLFGTRWSYPTKIWMKLLLSQRFLRVLHH